MEGREGYTTSLDEIRDWIAAVIVFPIFLWLIKMDKQDYYETIYRREFVKRANSKYNSYN